MSDDRERHIIDLDPSGEKWVVRPDEDDPPPDGSWAELTLDLGDPHKITTPESFVEDPPPPRRAQVTVGGFNEMVQLLTAADRFRTRLMRRDLRWMQSMVEAAGMEVILVRDAQEND